MSGQRGMVLIICLGFIVLLTLLVVAFLALMRADRQTTQNYSEAVQAQELAKGALEEIIQDFKSEIDAGSLQDGTPTGATYSTNGKNIFIPVSTSTSQPARIGFSATDYSTDVSTSKVPPTLIRVSRATADFYSSPPSDYNASLLPLNRASAAPSNMLSANGRRISAVRWNKPKLMGTTPPTVFADHLPEWVYVTRSGSRSFVVGDLSKLKSNKDLSQKDQVLGRYAFVVYDQGGLLDINTAGYPTTPLTSAPSVPQVRGKSALAYADLTQLPGMSGKQALLDTFLSWRSRGSLTSPSFGSGNFGLMVEKLTPEGFLKYHTNSSTGSSDNPFISRQDLIAYFEKKMGTQQPLAYLGTFSRSKNAPTWKPKTPTGSTIDYAAISETPSEVNRSFANVRFKASGDISHYLDDASVVTYNASIGEVLLQSRFSLARLGWLNQADPDTGNGPTATSTYGKAIQSCFGLVWDYPGGNGGATSANGGNKCWNYVGAGGAIASPPGTIKTLDVVASEKREPDFFELLKASILRGSLGKHPGAAIFVNGTKNDNPFPNGGSPYDLSYWLAGSGHGGLYGYTIGSATPAPAQIPDVQIIQIGANIIDQYDSDNYPTAIYFKYAGVGSFDPALSSGNPLLGPLTMVFGTENLPYMTRLVQINCSPSRSGTGIPSNNTDDATTSLAGWRQPEIWNPHQKPPGTLNAPKTFQIRAYGSAQTFFSVVNPTIDPGVNPYPWYYDGGHRKSGVSAVVDYYGAQPGPAGNTSTETSAVGTINFTDSSTTSSFYDHPYLLRTNITGVTVSSPANSPAAPPSGNNVALSNYPYYTVAGDATYNPVTNPFVAFSTGVTVTTPPNRSIVPTLPNEQPFYVSKSAGSTNVGSNAVDTTGLGSANSYALGWTDTSGKFHPYSFITGAFTYEYGVFNRNGSASDTRVGVITPDSQLYRYNPCMWYLADPRTSRFSMQMKMFGDGKPFGNNTIFPMNTVAMDANWTLICTPTGPGFTNASTVFLRDWTVNSSSSASYKSTYYSDPDGIIRPGDGIFMTPATGDGIMLLTSSAAPTGGVLSSTDNGGNVQHGRRPVILNRPFKSVGELGYVFRDLPFKSLDFFTTSSADAGLLDVFCLSDTVSVTNAKLFSLSAGRINPNAAPKSVLQAILRGGSKKESDEDYNLKDEAATIAGNIATLLNPSSSPSPISNPAGLVTELGSSPSTGSGPIRNGFSNSPDRGNKAYLEAATRALSNVTDTRTWNLLIDVIAQSGQVSSKAASLNDFFVEGERRYWLHVAIDRYTGEIIDQQLEPIYE